MILTDYPHWRLMTAWQLVKALACAGGSFAFAYFIFTSNSPIEPIASTLSGVFALIGLACGVQEANFGVQILKKKGQDVILADD